MLKILIPIVLITAILAHREIEIKRIEKANLVLEKDILNLKIQHQIEIQKSIKLDREYMVY